MPSFQCALVLLCFVVLYEAVVLPVKPGRPCHYKGKLYRNGKSFKDDCNTCNCRNGAVTCTEIACKEKAGTCPAIKPDVFGICVELCSSDQDCTDTAKCCSNGCGNVCTEPVSGCLVNGVNFKDGATVPSKTANPCEACTCHNGAVHCELMMCLACVGYKAPGECCPICGSGPLDAI